VGKKNTVLLQNGVFVKTAASQNGVCITQQMCHILILFYDCSMIQESNKKDLIFFVISEDGKSPNPSCETLPLGPISWPPYILQTHILHHLVKNKTVFRKAGPEGESALHVRGPAGGVQRGQDGDELGRGLPHLQVHRQER
jgi:hypothetical protein